MSSTSTSSTSKSSIDDPTLIIVPRSKEIEIEKDVDKEHNKMPKHSFEWIDNYIEKNRKNESQMTSSTSFLSTN